jgi:PIN domain nuclease of toxin-antitoxin system
VRLLLDSHAFLWFIAGDARLSRPARSAIEDPVNVVHVSAASVWEIGIKNSLGKLPLAEPFEVLIPRELTANGFRYLPIEILHIAASTRMPFHHYDPFDRLLIA